MGEPITVYDSEGNRFVVFAKSEAEKYSSMPPEAWALADWMEEHTIQDVLGLLEVIPRDVLAEHEASGRVRSTLLNTLAAPVTTLDNFLLESSLDEIHGFLAGNSDLTQVVLEHEQSGANRMELIGAWLIPPII